jgi:type III secretion system FlhB-like substrate exporter
MTRAVKLMVYVILVVAVARYVPVYYHTMMFNQYVHDQVPRIRMQAPLKEAILSKAEEHNIPITAQDISMTTSDSVLRVNVEYQVPINFYLFTRAFKSTAVGSGFLMRSRG